MVGIAEEEPVDIGRKVLASGPAGGAVSAIWFADDFCASTTSTFCSAVDAAVVNDANVEPSFFLEFANDFGDGIFFIACWNDDQGAKTDVCY